MKLALQFEEFVFARHWKFNHQLMRVGADEDIGGAALPLRVDLPVLLLGETLGHVHAAQEAGGGVVAGEGDVLIAQVHAVELLQFPDVLLTRHLITGYSII